MSSALIYLTPATVLPQVGGALSSTETTPPSLSLSFSTVAVMSTILRSASWPRMVSSLDTSSSEAESRTTPTVLPSTCTELHVPVYS